jgi:hypothetical protein
MVPDRGTRQTVTVATGSRGKAGHDAPAFFMSMSAYDEKKRRPEGRRLPWFAVRPDQSSSSDELLLLFELELLLPFEFELLFEFELELELLFELELELELELLLEFELLFEFDPPSLLPPKTSFRKS